ncbi:MAG: carbohydrate-binding protein, partial [Polyangiaceae bacterium]
IMKAAGGSFTNQAGIIDFNGHSYFFYHDGALQKGGSVPANGDGYHRSVCVEELAYQANGSFPTITATTGGPEPIAHLNPFLQTEAETIAWESGVQTEATSDTGGGMDVTSIQNGDYTKVRSVDFGTGATSFSARVASSTNGGNIELYLDGLTSSKIGGCVVTSTGGAQTWKTLTSCPVTGATGVHDLFLRFTGGSGDLFNLNWWHFEGPGANHSSDAGASDGSAPDGGDKAIEGGSIPGGGTSGGNSSGNRAPDGSNSDSDGSEPSADGSNDDGSTTGVESAKNGGGCSCRAAVHGRAGASALLPMMALVALRCRRRMKRMIGPALDAAFERGVTRSSHSACVHSNSDR